jgi:SAM-dependent methyltransferase
MDDAEVGRVWNANADGWTKLARTGFDVHRDLINTPAFLDMLPDVHRLSGVDIGCGEGHNTRLIARRGARMTAIDIAPRFIAHAREAESREPLRIRYLNASGQHLPFEDESFDFAVATMSLMDMPQADQVLREVNRVLKPNGFFQFSITHPCFTTPYRKLVRDENGMELYVQLAGYFTPQHGAIEEWIFSAASPEARAGVSKFRVPRFARTLSGWLNLVIDSGFTIERVNEPFADEDLAKRRSEVRDTRLVGYFLHVRCRKR